MGLSVVYGRDFRREARLFEDRSLLERRAEEVLSQEELAPRRWAARLAPEDLPDFAGFELGRVYQAGTGLHGRRLLRRVPRRRPTRIAAVIGDVTGHGIEPSITAFQAKYLLRVFLRQYRDPAQALEELNRQMSALERVRGVHLDLRRRVRHRGRPRCAYASAGHPAAWLWHDREVRPLRATGPLLMLDPDGELHEPRDRRSTTGDLLLALHRRPGRGPRRRAALRRGPRRPTSCAAIPASPPTCCARRCSRRPATSPPSP